MVLTSKKVSFIFLKNIRKVKDICRDFLKTASEYKQSENARNTNDKNKTTVFAGTFIGFLDSFSKQKTSYCAMSRVQVGNIPAHTIPCVIHKLFRV